MLCAGKPLWVSFTLEDSDRCVLRCGTPLSEALHTLFSSGDCGHVRALLVNCCAPRAATAALPALRCAADALQQQQQQQQRQQQQEIDQQQQQQEVMCGVYANGFFTTTSQWLQSTTSTGSSQAQPLLQQDEGNVVCCGKHVGACSEWPSAWLPVGATN